MKRLLYTGVDDWVAVYVDNNRVPACSGHRVDDSDWITLLGDGPYETQNERHSAGAYKVIAEHGDFPATEDEYWAQVAG